MARRSKYEDNPELIRWCVEMRAAGLSYGEIHARLSTTMRSKLRLESIPSEDTIRRLINKYRADEEIRSSVLPADQLEAHHLHLTNFGIAVRTCLTTPRFFRFGSFDELDESLDENWEGFADDIDDVDTSRLDRVVLDEFPVNGHVPRSGASYSDFMSHLEGSEEGREVLGAFEQLRKAASDRSEAALQFLDRVSDSTLEANEKFGELHGPRYFRHLLKVLDWRNHINRQAIIDSLEDGSERQWILDSLSTIMEQLDHNQVMSIEALSVLKRVKHTLQSDTRLYRMMMEGSCSLCTRTRAGLRSTEVVLA